MEKVLAHVFLPVGNGKWVNETVDLYTPDETKKILGSHEWSVGYDIYDPTDVKKRIGSSFVVENGMTIYCGVRR